VSSWKAGHDDIAALVERGHLERISGQAADGNYLVTQARQRLAGARAALSADSIGAFELAYDGTRLAATALLVQQGLRPKTAGGHIAVITAVRAQFGDRFEMFDAMRRVRNKLEYPVSPSDLAVSAETVDRALEYADATIAAAEQLLPELGMWLP
jgi:hypothetical protein